MLLNIDFPPSIVEDIAQLVFSFKFYNYFRLLVVVVLSISAPYTQASFSVGGESVYKALMTSL